MMDEDEKATPAPPPKIDSKRLNCRIDTKAITTTIINDKTLQQQQRIKAISCVQQRQHIL